MKGALFCAKDNFTHKRLGGFNFRWDETFLTSDCRRGGFNSRIGQNWFKFSWGRGYLPFNIFLQQIRITGSVQATLKSYYLQTEYKPNWQHQFTIYQDPKNRVTRCQSLNTFYLWTSVHKMLHIYCVAKSLLNVETTSSKGMLDKIEIRSREHPNTFDFLPDSRLEGIFNYRRCFLMFVGNIRTT